MRAARDRHDRHWLVADPLQVTQLKWQVWVAQFPFWSMMKFWLHWQVFPFKKALTLQEVQMVGPPEQVLQVLAHWRQFPVFESR